jgi:hypothetical protein
VITGWKAWATNFPPSPVDQAGLFLLKIGAGVGINWQKPLFSVEVSNMAEAAEKEVIAPEKIWSGSSFINYARHLRTLLAELPRSAETGPGKNYPRWYAGELDYVYGEIMFNLLSFEGYLRDKAFPIKECSIGQMVAPGKHLLEFTIHYKTKAGQELTRSSEVMRTGTRRFIFYTEPIYQKYL